GTQLALGSTLSPLNEPPSRPPQSDGGAKEQKRKGNQKAIGNFEPIAEERRPELGSLFAAMLSIFLGFASFGRGVTVWDYCRGIAATRAEDVVGPAMFSAARVFVGESLFPFGDRHLVDLLRQFGAGHLGSPQLRGKNGMPNSISHKRGIIHIQRV